MNQLSTWECFGTGSKIFMINDQLGVTDRYRYLNKLSMFVRAKGPLKLRGKGSEIKGFGSILLLLWNEFKNDSLETHRMITAMLKLNVEMEKLLAENKCYDAFPPIPAKRTVLIKWHMCNVCFMNALLMNLDLLCLQLLPNSTHSSTLLHWQLS